jgi:hypothetical protein
MSLCLPSCCLESLQDPASGIGNNQAVVAKTVVGIARVIT